MKFATTTVAALVLGLCTAVALGDDIAPPDYRGQPVSTFVHWDFGVTGANPVDFGFGPDPDGLTGPITPNTAVDPSLQIFTPDPQHPFTTYLFTMPNWIDDLPLKKLRIQITYTDLIAGDGSFPVPAIANLSATDNGNAVNPSGIINTFVTTPENVDLDTFFFFMDWEIRPNPDFETFEVQVPSGVSLDQVVFDSISIPEPASLALIGLGTLVGLRRSQRTHT